MDRKVIGRGTDRELLRLIARRLAQESPDADRLRAAVQPPSSGAREETPSKGGILKALLRSPLIGSNLDLTREREYGHDVDFG